MTFVREIYTLILSLTGYNYVLSSSLFWILLDTSDRKHHYKMLYRFIGKCMCYTYRHVVCSNLGCIFCYEWDRSN